MVAMPSSCTYRSHLKMSGKTQDAMEATLLIEKNLLVVFLDLHDLGSTHADPHICGFLENHFLEEEVKLIKKMGDYLSNFFQAGWSPGWVGQHLSKCSPLLQLGASEDQWPLRNPITSGLPEAPLCKH